MTEKEINEVDPEIEMVNTYNEDDEKDDLFERKLAEMQNKYQRGVKSGINLNRGEDELLKKTSGMDVINMLKEEFEKNPIPEPSDGVGGMF